MAFPITEHIVKTARHTSFYLACGAAEATPIIFLHGWPELSISWRHQLPVFAALGFRAIAPDMRGYGRSSVYARHEDYAQEQIVADMIELLDALGARGRSGSATTGARPWCGDRAAPPGRLHGVASLCVPYLPTRLHRGTRDRARRIARCIPEDKFPAAQWDYQLFYRENFAGATAGFEATCAPPSRRCSARGTRRAGASRSSPRSRKNGGLFGPGGAAPDVPRDGRC